MSGLASLVSSERLFENVQVSHSNEQFSIKQEFIPLQQGKTFSLIVVDQADDLLLRLINVEPSIQEPNSYGHQINEPVLELNLHRDSDCFAFNQTYYIIYYDTHKLLYTLCFKDNKDQNRFAKLICDFKQNKKQSTFNQRTDSVSASQYFQFYGYLSQQQNMMQDYIRTSTYQKSIHTNSEDFKDKIVLDVGAGSGILSFFALQAGARKVYAVEASSMAKHAQLLVQSNNLSNRIIVLAGKLEEIELPEPVDVIISEPMGYMLFNERMLETYVHAKKWFRNPAQGKMYPSRGDLHIAPFTDAQLYLEQINKANFWFASDFHGLDLRALHSEATKEYFRQPIVDTFDIRICMAKTVRHVIDFRTAHETDLHCISIPLEYVANQTGHIHGLAFWFDVAFIGTSHTIWLSTSPTQPLTHWYQVRCLLNSPLFVNKGQTICGSCILRSNKRQSYDVDIELFVKELGTRSSNTLDLKNPYFRYTGQPVQPPPGVNETSPSEQLWSTMTHEQNYPVNTIPSINPIVNSLAQNQNAAGLPTSAFLINDKSYVQQNQVQQLHQQQQQHLQLQQQQQQSALQRNLQQTSIQNMHSIV